MSFNGHVNPIDLSCWVLCSSCLRCQDKGRYAKCNSCSGRFDPKLRRDPYDRDDRCRCKEGTLQYRIKLGKLIIRKFTSNPFAGKVKTDAVSSDERDWNAYVAEQKEILNNEHWDPIEFY